MEFVTDARLFSPGAPDRGTLAMLSVARFSPGMRVLDLGCGWGLVGVYAALAAGERGVVMTDVDPLAVAMAARNAAQNGVGGVRTLVSNGFTALDETGFDLILSNPPYHTDFAVAKHFIEKGFNRLAIGGSILMVTKRKTWYQNKFTAIFGGVKVHEIDGYFVFAAQRRDYHYANTHAKSGAT
jgi:16S rRNA (guanine1207-N2)-methyltransferase